MVLRTLKCRYHVAPVSALRELKIWNGVLILINNPQFIPDLPSSFCSFGTFLSDLSDFNI